MPHFYEAMDDSAEFTEPEVMETCANEECGRKFWPSSSTAEVPSRFCSVECELNESEAE